MFLKAHMGTEAHVKLYWDNGCLDVLAGGHLALQPHRPPMVPAFICGWPAIAPPRSLHQAACCSLLYSLRGNTYSHSLLPTGPCSPWSSWRHLPDKTNTSRGSALMASGAVGNLSADPPLPPMRRAVGSWNGGRGAAGVALPSVVSGPPLGQGLQPENGQGTTRFRKSGAQRPR